MKLSLREARGISIGIEFVVSVLLGLAFGWWLDKKFGTAPWLLLVGTAFGAAAGFRSLFRAMKESARSSNGGRNPPTQS